MTRVVVLALFSESIAAAIVHMVLTVNFLWFHIPLVLTLHVCTRLALPFVVASPLVLFCFQSALNPTTALAIEKFFLSSFLSICCFLFLSQLISVIDLFPQHQFCETLPRSLSDDLSFIQQVLKTAIKYVVIVSPNVSVVQTGQAVVVLGTPFVVRARSWKRWPKRLLSTSL